MMFQSQPQRISTFRVGRGLRPMLSAVPTTHNIPARTNPLVTAVVCGAAGKHYVMFGSLGSREKGSRPFIPCFNPSDIGMGVSGIGSAESSADVGSTPTTPNPSDKGSDEV